MPGATPELLQVVLQQGQLSEAWQELTADVPEPVIRVVAALLVVVVGWLLSKLVVRLFARSIARRYRRPSVSRAVLRSLKLLVMTVSVLFAATVLGFQPGDLLISVTVLSAAIGIILAPIVGSIISGLFVLADQPYEIGDMIELADRDQRGFVEDITLRYTKIFTLDNTFVVIPNSTIRDRDVINYSAEDERTRRSLPILITYESDTVRAREVIERAARNVDAVITGGPDIRVGSARYPAGPVCYVDEFATNGILLTLRYWVTEPYKLLAARSRIQHHIEAALEDEDIEFAYPHTHHVFDETSGRARVAVGDGPQADDPGAGSAYADPVDGSDHIEVGDSAPGADAGDDSLDGTDESSDTDGRD